MIIRYEYNDQLASPVDLTPGPSEVHSILKVDSKRGKVYYLATAPGQPTQRNLYSVPLDGSEKPTCISCEYVTPEGKFSKIHFVFSRKYKEEETKQT